MLDDGLRVSNWRQLLMSLAWSSELDQSPITLPTGNYKRAHDKPLPLNTITLNQSMLQHLLQHTTTDAIFSQSFTCRHSRHNSSFSTKLATLCKSGPFRNFRHVAIECTISGDLDPWFWGDKKSVYWLLFNDTQMHRTRCYRVAPLDEPGGWMFQR